MLGGEASVKEASRRCGVAEQAVHNWMRALLDAGRDRSQGPGPGSQAAFVA